MSNQTEAEVLAWKIAEEAGRTPGVALAALREAKIASMRIPGTISK